MPTEQLLTAMGKYNEELVKAGIMLAGEGCTPARRARASGSRETADRHRRAVRRDEGTDRRLLAVAGEVDGGGDRLGQALSQSDGEESEIEIRQVFEAEDFGAEFTPELREQEERLRAQISKKK